MLLGLFGGLTLFQGSWVERQLIANFRDSDFFWSLLYLGYSRRHWFTRTWWLSRPEGKDLPEVVSTVDSLPRHSFLCNKIKQGCFFPPYYPFCLSISYYPVSISLSSMSVSFIKTWELLSNLSKWATPFSECSHNLNIICTELCALV